jgi:uncharacterized protein
MTARQLRSLFVLFIVLSLSAAAEKVSDIHPVNYVTDLAGVIDASTAARVNALAGDVERKTGAQIAVVTVKSLEDRPIEDYAVDLFKHLGVGHKDDRGVLLLLAPAARRYRIEVGYGLEPVINDARAGDIGRAMVPYLRQNDYSSAVELAVGRLATYIAEASHVTLDQKPASVNPSGESEPAEQFPWWVLPLGFFGLLVVVRMLRGARRRRFASGSFPWWWLGPGGGGWGGGGWSSGGWGGSSDGGGFSFGGFGGGSSGGGGASGSW